MNASSANIVAWVIACLAVLAVGTGSAFLVKKQKALAKKREEQAKKQEKLTIVGMVVTVVTAIVGAWVASQCASP